MCPRFVHRGHRGWPSPIATPVPPCSACSAWMATTGGELQDMAFWSLSIPPGGKPCTFEIEQTATRAQYVHVTNAAVAHGGKPGPHTITVTLNENDVTVCTLDQDKHPQHPLDFVLDQTITFKNFGPSAVHLLGYQTTADAHDLAQSEDYDDEDDDDEEDEDEEGDEDDADDDEAPPGVPIANGRRPVSAPKQRLCSSAAGPGAASCGVNGSHDGA